MAKRIITLSAAAALTLAALASTANAEDFGVVHGVKTVGAMTLESAGRATSARGVLRQGGLATAGTVRWIPAADQPQRDTSAVHGVGSVGAMTLETRGLPTSAADVYRLGGGAAARSVRWVFAPAS